MRWHVNVNGTIYEDFWPSIDRAAGGAVRWYRHAMEEAAELKAKADGVAVEWPIVIDDLAIVIRLADRQDEP